MKKGLFVLAVLVMAFGNVSFAQHKANLKSNATQHVLKHYGIRDETTLAPQTATWETTDGEQYRTTYVYDEYDYYLIMEMTEIKDDDNWQNFSVLNYEYDFSGNVLEILAEMYLYGDVWVPDAKASFSYESGELSEVIYQYWEDGNWMNETKEVYNYAGDVTTILFWDWNGTTWSSDELWTYTDDGMGTIELLVQYMEGGAWQNDERVTYEKQFTGALISILYEDWVNNAWENEQYVGYIYQPDGNDKGVAFWVNGAWQLKYQFEFDYENYNAIHGVCLEKDDDQWIPADGDIEMFYDEYAAAKIFYGHEVDMTYIDLTSLKENTQAANFKVYPIPAESEILIEADDFQKAEIYSLSGQKLVESQSEKMNVGALSSGIYLLKVFDRAGNAETQKLMVK